MVTMDERLLLRQRLKQLRKEQNLTQRELAQRAHISTFYLQILESSRLGNPTFSVLARLAKAFGIPLWEFLKFDQ